MSEKYGSNFHAEFFVAGCDHDHNDRDVRVNQYKSIAKKIIDIFAPKTFLDVGCAYGYLVEALRDLGVEAYGMDASSHAISMVREDIKPYCFIADAMEKLPNSLPERFDCVSSIEVVEQLCEEDAQSFIHILCSCTDTVIFLSAADDFKEKKHYNVQQEDWAKRFALEGFLRDLVTDISFISAEALIYRKEKKTTLKLIEDYERAARLERAFCKKELQSVIDNKDDIEKSLEELQREMETVNREKNVISLELKNLRIHKHKLEADYNSIKNSTFWKLTLPAQRIVGGIRKLFKLNSSPSTSPAKDSSISAASYWKTYHPKAIPSPTVAPIDTYFLDEKVARLNLVVDGIDAVNLLGGVATSLILATLFVSRHKGMILRIITRHFPADPLDYLYIMEMNGIAPAQQVEYYSDWNRDEHGHTVTKMPLTSEDVFMATSWWSAKVIEEISLRKRFFYIIQEVEPFFYYYGDEHLLCRQILQNPDIDFIVNSHYLWDYFSEVLPNITRNGVYFEPAFSEALYLRKQFSEKKEGEKYSLFFYARPNNPRNLFGAGILLLDEAIKKGILNTDEWEINFVGQDIPDIIFCDGTKPKAFGQLSWNDYRNFLSDIDLALSLMYTPHPSYPPYDVAVSGGVVVTNKFMNKTSFDQSDNVIMTDLDNESFLEALDEGIRLAKNLQQREKNYRNTTIERNWEKALQVVLEKMEEWL